MAAKPIVPTLREKLFAAEEALRKSEQRSVAGQLALEMMHEVRNPLEALGHLVYLTREQADDPTQVREHMQMAEEQMALLSEVTNQTLGFARSTPPSMMDLAALTEAALRIHHRALEAKDIRVVRKFSGKIEAQVQRGGMLQVISNLIVNAIEALHVGGTLQVRIRKTTDRIHLVVADNGCGISPKHLSSLFEPFFTTKEECGTGLGLHLSKKIIERHGGTIGVRSVVREGRSGTTFKICLPLNTPALASPCRSD